MTVIHTLGPQQTDSNRAAEYFVQKHSDQDWTISLHASFEHILMNLSDYAGDQLLIPAAFQSKQLQLAWGDVHYLYLRQLALKETFIYDLDPLVLLENTLVANQVGYTHAATARLLEQYIPDVQVQTAPSKYLAYQEYRKNGQYALTNEQLITLMPYERQIARIEVPMVWCRYQIKEDD